MNYIKSLILNRFDTIFKVSLSIIISLTLLIIRLKIHQSFFLLFLVWNIFLAIIPFAITLHLKFHKSENKFTFFLWFFLWLLFLPNAPYIVTDFVHLKHNTGYYKWLDFLLILSFAINGLIMFCISLQDMKQLLKTYIKWSIYRTFDVLICLLSAFGIYIGRFLRFNSWDIIQDPIQLINEIMTLILKPVSSWKVWLFILVFGIFLIIIFNIYTWYINSHKLKVYGVQ